MSLVLSIYNWGSRQLTKIREPNFNPFDFLSIAQIPAGVVVLGRTISNQQDCVGILPFEPGGFRMVSVDIRPIASRRTPIAYVPQVGIVCYQDSKLKQLLDTKLTVPLQSITIDISDEPSVLLSNRSATEPRLCWANDGRTGATLRTHFTKMTVFSWNEQRVLMRKTFDKELSSYGIDGDLKKLFFIGPESRIHQLDVRTGEIAVFSEQPLDSKDENLEIIATH